MAQWRYQWWGALQHFPGGAPCLTSVWMVCTGLPYCLPPPASLTHLYIWETEGMMWETFGRMCPIFNDLGQHSRFSQASPFPGWNSLEHIIPVRCAESGSKWSLNHMGLVVGKGQKLELKPA